MNCRTHYSNRESFINKTALMMSRLATIFWVSVVGNFGFSLSDISQALFDNDLTDFMSSDSLQLNGSPSITHTSTDLSHSNLSASHVSFGQLLTGPVSSNLGQTSASAWPQQLSTPALSSYQNQDHNRISRGGFRKN